MKLPALMEIRILYSSQIQN